jgi:hypothetical protein
MAYARTAVSAHDLAFTKPSTRPAGQSWLNRLFATMTAARMRQAEREVARYLRDTGGKFTDEAERDIERRFLSNQSRW